MSIVKNLKKDSRRGLKMKSSFKLNKKRCLFLKSSFNENYAKELVEKLFDLDKSEGEIFLYINSSGGDVSAFKILYDNISLCQNKVIGVVAGSCFSAATLILQACNKRCATPLSVLGFHYMNYPISFTIKNDKNIGYYIKFIEDEFNFMHQNNKIIKNILVSKMNIDEDKVHQIALEGKELNVDEALEFGLIDEIISY